MEKTIIKDLNSFPDIKLQIKNERSIFFDIGYGDKFFIYYMEIKDLDKLSDFSTYTIFKEIVNKYIKIGYPKGFRTRFFINFDDNVQKLKKNIDDIKKENVLLVFRLNNAGVGNEKFAVNNLRKNLVRKLEKLIENYGLYTSLIVDKEFDFNLEDVNTLWLKPYPNNFYQSLDKRFFSEELKNKAVFTINIVSKKILE